MYTLIAIQFEERDLEDMHPQYVDYKKRVPAMAIVSDNQSWLKRLGIVGFWFFLIKGLLWLAAPVVFFLLV
ncbi:MAG: hypothetical protein WBN09_01435 [Woeseiaceae bacterium]